MSSAQELGANLDPEQQAQPLDILLIEDNAGDARLVEEFLSEDPIDATLRVEGSLEKGLQSASRGRPDVLLLDLGLPDSEGVEAVRQSAKSFPALPIVVLTGREEIGVALQAQEAGADQYLQKDELTPALVARTLRWAVERRRMERQVQRKEDWIEAITENISGGVFRVAEGDGIQHVNDGFLNLLGYESQEEVRGQPLSTLIAADGAEGLEESLRTEGEFGPVEVQFRRSDGSTFVGALSIQAAEGEGPHPRGNGGGEAIRHYDGVVTDTTDESAVRRRRLRVLSEALEQSRDSVLITEADPLSKPGPQIVYVNEAFEEMTGYSKEEIIGQTPRVLQGEETDPDVLDSLASALDAGRTWMGETINYRKNGEPYRVQWNVAPVRREEGEIEHWVSVQRDVTDERRREEALQARERQIRALANSVPGGVFQFEVLPDGEQTFTFVSDQAEEFLGISADPDGYFDRFVERVPPSHREKLLASIEEAVEEGTLWDHEMPFDRPDGTRIWVRGISTPERRETSEGEKFIFHGVTIDVTERRKAERRYEAIFNQTYQFIGLMEPDGTLIEANDTALKVAGLSEEDVLGKPVWEARWWQTNPETPERLKEAVGRAARGEFIRYEETIQSLEGKRVIDFSIRPLTDEEGNVTLLIPEGRDITERKERETEAERRAHAMGVVSDGIAILGPEGRYLYVNDAHAEIYGYDGPEKLLGNRWHMCYGEAETTRLEEEVMPTLRADGTWQGEAVGRRSDGTRFDQALTLTSLDEGGIICVVRDITERKERERELLRRERRYQAIFEDPGMLVGRLDPDGTLMEVNRTAMQYTEASEEDVIGQPFWDTPWWWGESESALRDKIEQAAGGEYVSYEASHTMPDGTLRTVEGTIRPVAGPSGEVVSLVVSARDVTERKTHERELRRAKEKAEEAARFKSAMMANMSHEFRTPMTSILGFADAIRQEVGAVATEGVDDEVTAALDSARRFAGLIRKGGERLQDTLSTVLELSRLQSNEADLDLEQVNVMEVIKSVEETGRPEAEDAGLDLEVESPADPLWAQGNPDGLEVALQKIVGNAIKFTGPGGQVALRAREDAGEAVIGVEDSGIGMKPSEVEQLFEAFEQESEGLGREYEGSGLGLTVAQTLIKQMGGGLQVHTTKGEGSRFIIRLPRGEPRS